MFKLTLTMWVCRQELQSSKMDLERLRAEGGGHAVLDFVRIGAEWRGQATCVKEWACGSAVSSIKGKKSDNGIEQFPSVADKSSDGPGGSSSRSGQFPGVIWVAHEIIMSWT